MKTRAELSADTSSRAGDSPPGKNTPRGPSQAKNLVPWLPSEPRPRLSLASPQRENVAAGARYRRSSFTSAWDRRPPCAAGGVFNSRSDVRSVPARGVWCPRGGGSSPPRAGPGCRAACPVGGPGRRLPAPAARRAAATRHVLCPFAERTWPAQRPRTQKLAEGGPSRTPLSGPVRLSLSRTFGE